MTRKQIKSYITFALVLGLVVGVFTVFFEKTVNYLLIFEDGKKFQDYQNVYVLGEKKPSSGKTGRLSTLSPICRPKGIAAWPAAQQERRQRILD